MPGKRAKRYGPRRFCHVACADPIFNNIAQRGQEAILTIGHKELGNRLAGDFGSFEINAAENLADLAEIGRNYRSLHGHIFEQLGGGTKKSASIGIRDMGRKKYIRRRKIGW